MQRYLTGSFMIAHMEVRYLLWTLDNIVLRIYNDVMRKSHEQRLITK